MPPTPSRGISQLTEEAKAALMDNFKMHRDELACHACGSIGRLRRCGFSNDKTRRPLFACSSCSARPNHDIILKAIQLHLKGANLGPSTPTTQETPTNSQSQANTEEHMAAETVAPNAPLSQPNWADIMDEENDTNVFAPDTQVTPLVFEHYEALPDHMQVIVRTLNELQAKVECHDHLVMELKDLSARLLEVTRDLTAANARVADLERDNAALRASIATSPPASSTNGIYASIHAPKIQETPQCATTTPTTSQPSTIPNVWKNANRTKMLRISRPAPSPAVLQRRTEAASRAFQLPSATHGFQLVHLPSRARMRKSQLRANLRRLGVDNGRILDIHYPDRQVVSLLTHNDYVPELLTCFEKARIAPLTNFDPCDPDRLRNPAYASLSPEDRAEKARHHHHERMLRAIDTIRDPVRLSVARDFLRQGLITEAELQAAIAGKKLATPLPPRQTNPDDGANFRPLEEADTEMEGVDDDTTSARLASPTPNRL